MWEFNGELLRAAVSFLVSFEYETPGRAQPAWSHPARSKRGSRLCWPPLAGGDAQFRRGAAPSGRLLGAVAGVRRAGDSGQRRLHGSRQLGDGPARRRSVQIRALVGGRTSQPHGHLHAGDFRPFGRSNRQGPRAVLPRLVSAVDPLAQLADERSGDWRLRPGGGARERRSPQLAVPYPAAVGGHHHWPGRACCSWRCSALACAPSRPSSCC